MHKPTVAEVAEASGLSQAQVRMVIRTLADMGIIAVTEPGEIIESAVQPGTADYGTPDPLDYTLNEDLTVDEDKGDTKG
ncbi:MAG: hypothetical protein ACOYD6_03925 [Limnochordia bacterium]